MEKQDWLDLWMDYTSDAPFPTDFRKWSGLFCISSVLRRRLWFARSTYKWFPNIYLILVSEPAVGKKSTVIGLVRKLIGADKQIVPPIKIAPDACTWQALVQEMGKSVVDTRVTDERTGVVTFGKACHMCILSAELSSFLDVNNREMTSALTDLWDCRTGIWLKATKGSGTDKIHNPYICLMAGTTPQHLIGYDRRFTEAGFISRSIFLWQETPVLDEDIYADRGAAKRKIFTQLLDGLKGFGSLGGNVRISDEAREFGNDWRKKFELAVSRRELSATWAGRRVQMAHQTAMLLSVSRGGRGDIELRDLQRGVEMLDEVAPQVAKVLKIIESDPTHYIRERAVAFIRSKGKKGCSVAELWRSVSHLSNPMVVEKALEQLIRHGDDAFTEVEGGRLYATSPALRTE